MKRTLNVRQETSYSMHLVRCIALASIATLCGCVTPRTDVTLVGSPQELPSIQEVYAQRLSQLSIGMSLGDFQKTFPEAYVAGQLGNTTAYEVSKKTKYALKRDWNPYYASVQDFAIQTENQVLWFYFNQGILVKWGRPQDWPERPDEIIEIRTK